MLSQGDEVATDDVMDPIQTQVPESASDVLEDHRARNRPVQPPRPEVLANAAAYQNLTRQLQEKAAKEDALIQDEDGNVTDASDGDDSVVQGRANRHSKTPYNAAPKPTTLRYYSTSWWGVLECAKHRMRRHVALVHAFPRREADLGVSSKLIANSRAEYLEYDDHLPLEPGFFFSFIFNLIY